jgi:hypothetical protein
MRWTDKDEWWIIEELEEGGYDLFEDSRWDWERPQKPETG